MLRGKRDATYGDMEWGLVRFVDAVYAQVPKPTYKLEPPQGHK